MAASGAAPGPSTSNWNMNQTQEDLDKIAEANELFDAVLTGSVDLDKNVKKKVSPAMKASSSNERKSTDEREGISNKRLALYIGNFPWWTSDSDLTSMALTLGVEDIREIKFAENKVNGQSRGYAEVVVATTESLKTLLEKVPQCRVNGERVECRFATQQNLTLFENVANKRIPPRDSKDSDSSDTVAPSSSQEPSTLPKPPFFPTSPPPPLPFLSQQPPPFPLMPPNMSVPPPFIFPHSHQIPIQVPPSLHINPAFFNQDGHSSRMQSQQKQTPQVTDGDFEELMSRNRAVASSAISKAVSGAAAGDRDVSMETLLTAIAIIKQSRVYGDERCQALVTSLKDCLVSIQGNYNYRSRSREKDRGRDRERERERTEEDYSGWEGSRRREGRRERSWSREKSREHSRDRDRHRDYRDRYR